MAPILFDIGKEIVVMAMTGGLSWVLHHIQRLKRDLDAHFRKQRRADRRLRRLERHLGLKAIEDDRDFDDEDDKAS